MSQYHQNYVKQQNVIHCSSKGKVKKYVEYALKLFEKGNFQTVYLRATGSNAMEIAYNVAQILKKSVQNLSQMNDIIDKQEHGRVITVLRIVLTTKQSKKGDDQKRRACHKIKDQEDDRKCYQHKQKNYRKKRNYKYKSKYERQGDRISYQSDSSDYGQENIQKYHKKHQSQKRGKLYYSNSKNQRQDRSYNSRRNRDYYSEDSWNSFDSSYSDYDYEKRRNRNQKNQKSDKRRNRNRANNYRRNKNHYSVDSRDSYDSSYSDYSYQNRKNYHKKQKIQKSDKSNTNRRASNYQIKEKNRNFDSFSSEESKNNKSQPISQQKLKKKRQQSPKQENLIRCWANGEPEQYVEQALNLLEKFTSITLKATGRALKIAVQVAELLKEKVKNLHQINKIVLKANDHGTLLIHNLENIKFTNEEKSLQKVSEKVVQQENIKELNIMLTIIPQLKKYQKVEKELIQPKAKLENEIYFNEKDTKEKQIALALNLFKDLTFKTVTFFATENSIKSALSTAEDLKKKLINLRQINNFQTLKLFDEYEPLEEGLDKVK